MADNRVGGSTGGRAYGLKSWWRVDRYDTGSSAWVADSAIPAPGIEQINHSFKTTAMMVSMVDGSMGRAVSDIRGNYDTFRFLFNRRTYSPNLYSQFYGYMVSQTGIRVTTNTLEFFEGYVDQVDRVWDLMPGHNNAQQYQIEVTFQPFDVDGNGTIGGSA